MMVRILPRLAAARPPRMPRRERVGTTRSGARRVEGAPHRVRYGGTGSGRQRTHAGGPRPPSLRGEAPSGGPSAEFSGPLGAGLGSVRTMARRRALSARGLAAISAGDGFLAPRNTSWCRATAPQTQGRPGGHTHPPEAAGGEGLLRQAVLAGVAADHGAHSPDREVRQRDRERRCRAGPARRSPRSGALGTPGAPGGPCAGPAPARPTPRRRPTASWRSVAGRHDRPGDAPGQPPLSVLTEECRQGVRGEAVDQVAGGGTGGRVHPHVERPVLPERKPLLGPVELGS